MKRMHDITEESKRNAGTFNGRETTHPMPQEATGPSHGPILGNAGDQATGVGTVLRLDTGSMPAGAAGVNPDGLVVAPAGTLLTEEAMAKCLSVTSRTIRRMVQRGQLPEGIKLGSRRVWIAAKVMEFLTEKADKLAQEAKRREQRYRVAI